MQYDVIIIGTGASGLMAAKDLANAGKKVLILEARHRPGGRMETLTSKGFTQPIETGAEFIHGNLPLTLQLCKEYHLPYTKVAGAMPRKVNGVWTEDDEQVEGWGELMDKMRTLMQDMPMNDFLNTYFAGEKFTLLRQSAQQYAAGFDLADPEKVSIFSLRNEWQHEEEDMYRIDGGYENLVNALCNDCVHNGATLHFDTVAKTIEWQPQKVTVTSAANEVFYGEKLMITVPVSVLQQDAEDISKLTFIPAIPETIKQVKQIGFGSIIKVLLEFKTAFWQDIQKDALFFFGDEEIPTWWTQYPLNYALLTGWLGGPKAKELSNESDEIILQKSLQSLSAMFDKPVEELQQQLVAKHVANWQQDIFAKGGYSYETVTAAAAKKLLFTPIKNTLYFAGEGLYAGNAQSTVEAALVTGKAVAAMITNVHK